MNRVKWNNKGKVYKYKLYFYYNKKTKAKEKLVKRLFNFS